MAIAAAFNLAPEKAVEFFRPKGLATSFAWQDMLHEEHDHYFTIAKMLDLDLLGDMKKYVDRAISEGWTRTQFVERLIPDLMVRGWWGRQEMIDPATGETVEAQLGSVRRLKTIYDTNLRTSYAAGHWERIETNKRTAPYVMYSAILDGRTRAAHAAWNGKILRHDDPWWKSHTPPNGWNCFPAGTHVRADAQLGLKTWYAGAMVEINTRQGNRLTATANHPVLTGRGWRRACDLEKGDQLLSDRGVVDTGLVGIVDDQQPPVLVEQLFESLRAQGFRIVPMAPHDFHGDALSRKPEIHVAGADSDLVNESKPAAHQLVGERQLGRADGSFVMHSDIAVRPAQRSTIVADAVHAQDATDVARAGLERARDRTFGNQPAAIEREHAPLQMRVAGASGNPSGAELALDAGRSGLDSAPFEPLGLGSSAQFNSAQPELAAERVAAASGLFSQLLETNAGLVTADEVVDVRQFEWAGHVFDFQTRTGLIVAGGLITHNCRCTVIQLSDRDLKRMGKEGPDESPKFETREWTNPRSGEVLQVPLGVDPGWGYAPGDSRRTAALELAKEKLAAADPAFQAVGIKPFEPPPR